VDDIMTVLRRHSIDEQTQKDVLAIAYALKAEILHRQRQSPLDIS
jgi:hemoglobin